MAILHAAGCGAVPPKEDAALGVPLGVPLGEASVEPGQYFPSYLSTMKEVCGFPDTPASTVLNDLKTEWYSSTLAQAGERPLAELAAAEPERFHIRLLWLRTFHHPMIVRIEAEASGKAVLEAKLLSGQGGFEVGEVARSLRRELSPAEIRAIRNTLERFSLAAEPAGTCELGTDGAQWIVELADGGRYAFYDRWTPEKGAVREVGLAMLRLTGFDLEPIY